MMPKSSVEIFVQTRVTHSQFKSWDKLRGKYGHQCGAYHKASDTKVKIARVWRK